MVMLTYDIAEKILKYNEQDCRQPNLALEIYKIAYSDAAEPTTLNNCPIYDSQGKITDKVKSMLVPVSLKLREQALEVKKAGPLEKIVLPDLPKEIPEKYYPPTLLNLSEYLDPTSHLKPNGKRK